MSIQSFADYFLQQTGYDLTSLSIPNSGAQGQFSSNYTNWLDDVVLTDSDVQTWLHGQLSASQWSQFQSGQWHIDIEQNDAVAAPAIDFGDGSAFGLNALFAGDEPKDSFIWTQGHASQLRYYFDDAAVPGNSGPPVYFTIDFNNGPLHVVANSVDASNYVEH